jgi:hypothetical protein
MKVLLVHPEDGLPSGSGWDLIVDFGRAPASTYDRWSRQTGARAVTIYDFAAGIDDLRLCQKLLARGMGVLLDRYGIDWWDVLSMRLVPDLLQLLLIDRLCQSIDTPVQLFATRAFRWTTHLEQRLGVRTHIQCGSFAPRRIRHYWRALTSLDGHQIAQIVQDKFVQHHAARRTIPRSRRVNDGVILLPSAYINVSRMAVRYAELLPHQSFILVFCRQSGKLSSLPANVVPTALDSYFISHNNRDFGLLHEWSLLRKRLVESDGMIRAAEDCGMLQGLASTLQWLLPIRDAWNNILEGENVAGCFCADDTNPYTRIALWLTKARGLPTVACHHGALDCWMALKNPAANVYLAKSEMERDYLVNVCGVPTQKVVLGSPIGWTTACTTHAHEKRCIVLFTDAYEATGWRSDEVYQDLLPRLSALARSCNLKLVLKLHPFDSMRDHRRKLKRILKREARDVEIIAGAVTAGLWQNTKFALTCESSTALECAARGIPVFLCAWLRDCYSGYSDQYTKFGVGVSLTSPEQIAHIPQLLASREWGCASAEKSIRSEAFQDLFSGARESGLPLDEPMFATYAR